MGNDTHFDSINLNVLWRTLYFENVQFGKSLLFMKTIFVVHLKYYYAAYHFCQAGSLPYFLSLI